MLYNCASKLHGHQNIFFIISLSWMSLTHRKDDKQPYGEARGERWVENCCPLVQQRQTVDCRTQQVVDVFIVRQLVVFLVSLLFLCTNRFLFSVSFGYWNSWPKNWSVIQRLFFWTANNMASIRV